MPICDVAPPLRDVTPGIAPVGATRHLSRCWLTPAGEPPEVGVDPTAEVAAESAAALTVE